MGDHRTLHFMRTAGGLAHRNALRKRIERVQVQRLVFLDDHKVLTDIRPESDNWEAGGTRYVDLQGGAHWLPPAARSFPASVTKGTRLSLQVDLSVASADVDPIPCEIVATATDVPADSGAPGAFTFRATVELGGTPLVRVVLVADAALADQVFYCSDFSIVWNAQVAGRTLSAGTTGPHRLYITYGAPDPGGRPQPTPFGDAPPLLEDGITEKRMSSAVCTTESRWREAIKKVDPATGQPWDRNDPHVIVQWLMNWIPRYTLTRNPNVPRKYGHPQYHWDRTVDPPRQISAWPLADYAEYFAECQAIVRFIRGILLQVGCPGVVEHVLVYAHPDDGGTTVREDSVIPPDMDPSKYAMGKKGPTLPGGLAHPSAQAPGLASGLTDKVVLVGEIMPEHRVVNSFEACLKFTFGGRLAYYAGGGGGFSPSKEHVIHCFFQLIWFKYVDEHDKSAGNRVAAIVYPTTDPAVYGPKGDDARWPF